jgi:hypothetical protein
MNSHNSAAILVKTLRRQQTTLACAVLLVTSSLLALPPCATAVMPDVADTTAPEDLIKAVVGAYVKKQACITPMHGACEGNPVGERARAASMYLPTPVPKNNSTRLPACVSV